MSIRHVSTTYPADGHLFSAKLERLCTKKRVYDAVAYLKKAPQRLSNPVSYSVVMNAAVREKRGQLVWKLFNDA
jgi:hypothetical protein